MITLNNKRRFKTTYENLYKIPVSGVEKLRNKFYAIANHKIERFIPREGINGIKDFIYFEKNYISFDENGEIINLKEGFLKEYEDSIKEFHKDDNITKKKISKIMIYCYLLKDDDLYKLSHKIGDDKYLKELDGFKRRLNSPLSLLNTLKKLITEYDIRRTTEVDTIKRLKASYKDEIKEFDLNYVLKDCLEDINNSKKIEKEEKEKYVKIFNRMWDDFLKERK